MDEHNSFQLKGIDPPDSLDDELAAKITRCADFKVIYLLKSSIVVSRCLSKILFGEHIKGGAGSRARTGVQALVQGHI